MLKSAAMTTCSLETASMRLFRMQLLEQPKREQLTKRSSKSMTGFAAATREADTATITVTIRAVNHRHLDMQLRVPQSLAEAEGRIRATVRSAASGGGASNLQ